MSLWTAERQAQRRTELAAALKPQPCPSAWTPEQQHRHRTVLEQALDGTEWHQPIPARQARHQAALLADLRTRKAQP